MQIQYNTVKYRMQAAIPLKKRITAYNTGTCKGVFNESERPEYSPNTTPVIRLTWLTYTLLFHR